MAEIQFHEGDWSQLAAHRELPEIDAERMQRYRLGRIRDRLRTADVALGIFVNPVSLRYAVEYRGYALFQSHIPSTYLFVPVDGPVVMHGFFGPPPLMVDDVRPAHAISYFNGGGDLVERARCLATEVKEFLAEIGTDNRRIAVEYVNPSVTQAFEQQGLEVIDAVGLIEDARVIKSSDEIECMKWAIAVADLGITKIKEMMRPGISEVQLWALLNYTNLANNGDWHDGRMLVSGDRINPWYQEASERKLEAGDLLGFDTDMVGPFGYFADISRTFYCGPGRPTKRQKFLYRLAFDEIEHNLTLLKPGVTLQQISERAFVPPEEFHPNRYTCILHGVGMCDEFPKVYYPQDIEQRGYEGTIEKNMVLCVESYIGAVGERDGVKLEQQVLITDDGYELLSTYPFENELLE